MTKPTDLARRITYRLIPTDDPVKRLAAFLSNPANHRTSAGKRILELLEVARQRRDKGERP